MPLFYSNGIFTYNVSEKYVLKSGKHYTLEVNATDLLGNSAKPWRFLWLTGKPTDNSSLPSLYFQFL